MAPVEISSILIPSTQNKTDSNGKTYTAYTVAVSTPSSLRARALTKRYSDFLALNSSLVSECGKAPPAPLPGKSWWKGGTVNNESLREERRKGLEAYLQAILQDDGPWRTSSAWKRFLDLDTSSSQSAKARTGSMGSDRSAIAITDPSVWLDGHRDLKTALQDARIWLTRREQATTATPQHEAGAEAKKRLVRASTLTVALDEGLKILSDKESRASNQLGEGELRRRRDLINAARKEREGLESVLAALAVKSAQQPSPTNSSTADLTSNAPGAYPSANPSQTSLFRGAPSANTSASSSRRILGAPLKETNRTRELDNEGVVQLQRQIMREQDQDVDELTKVVRKLKGLGEDMNEELVLQAEMLRGVEEDADRLNSKIKIASKRADKVR